MPTGESVDWICQPQELHDQGKSLQTLPSVHLGEAGNLPSKYIGISTRKYQREEKQNPRWPRGLEPVTQLQSPAAGTAPLPLSNCSWFLPSLSPSLFPCLAPLSFPGLSPLTPGPPQLYDSAPDPAL